MNDEVKAFFEDMGRRGYYARLRAVSGTFEFAFDDDGAWRVTNTDGWVTVMEGHGEADTYIAISMDDFLSAARGQANPWTLQMQGRTRITGDWALAEVVQRLFPASDQKSVFAEGGLSGGTP